MTNLGIAACGPSAGAGDGDEIVAMRAVAAARSALRDRAGDVVAIDFAERQSLPVFVRVAVGVGSGFAAGCAGRQTVVDAVTVDTTRDNEDAPLRLRGGGGQQQRGKR